MTRPSDMLSSMAYSSATRSGLPCSGSRLASTTILPLLVFWVSADAMMLGDGISP